MNELRLTDYVILILGVMGLIILSEFIIDGNIYLKEKLKNRRKRINNMKIFKNYKKLYETELNNRKMYEERYRDKAKENEDYQRVINNQKKNIADLKLQVEDLTGFKEQETLAKKELLKQRGNYRKMITRLGGDWRKLENGRK